MYVCKPINLFHPFLVQCDSPYQDVGSNLRHKNPQFMFLSPNVCLHIIQSINPSLLPFPCSMISPIEIVGSKLNHENPPPHGSIY